MADSRQFYVPHPDFLSMSPSGRTVIIYEVEEDFSILDMLLMNKIEMAPANASKA